MRIWLAIRVFFAVLLHAELAARIQPLLAGASSSPAEPERPPVDTKSAAAAQPTSTKAAPSGQPAARVTAAPSRSEAITLLATLQREARFLDIVQEPLSSYSDAQIGAAARDVLQNCATVLERMFGIEPAVAQAEGSEVEVPHSYDPMRFRVVGNVSGEPPFRGKVTHPGWVASRCDLPAWNGSQQAANVLAPVEVEIG